MISAHHNGKPLKIITPNGSKDLVLDKWFENRQSPMANRSGADSKTNNKKFNIRNFMPDCQTKVGEQEL